MNKFVRKTALVICAAAEGLALAACETSGEHHYANGYGSNGRYDVWYDGFYGSVNGGYWGPDSAYYYPGADGHYVRDSGNHFRREGFDGGRGMYAGHQPN